MIAKRWFLLVLVLLLVGCAAEQTTPDVAPTETTAATVTTALLSPTTVAQTNTPEPTSTTAPTETAEPSPTPEPTRTPAPTETPEPTSMPEPTSTPEPTATPQPTATPDPYTGYYIEDLRQQQFGQEGEIEIVATLEERPTFTRYQIAFPSDGLSIGGFMNVPAGDGPFPVVILNHGYMPPASYELLTYTTKYADALANAGFLVVHPNFRNHRGSDEGQNPFRIGYARDVLHLIPMAQRLPQADGQPVGLWGHSMGGGVVLRVLAVSDDVGAAVLYGSMSGDEAKNYEAIMGWSNGTAAQNGSLPETPDNVAVYSAISPINYVEYLRAPLAIHHGVQDEQVPFSWSEELAQRLDEAGIPYDFWAYEGQPHNFTGAGYDLLNERVIAFFGEHLR